MRCLLRLLVSDVDTIAKCRPSSMLMDTVEWAVRRSPATLDFSGGSGAVPADTEELVTGLSVNKLQVGSGSTSLTAKFKLEWTDNGQASYVPTMLAEFDGSITWSQCDQLLSLRPLRWND